MLSLALLQLDCSSNKIFLIQIRFNNWISLIFLKSNLTYNLKNWYFLKSIETLIFEIKLETLIRRFKNQFDLIIIKIQWIRDIPPGSDATCLRAIHSKVNIIEVALPSYFSLPALSNEIWKPRSILMDLKSIWNPILVAAVSYTLTINH